MSLSLNVGRVERLIALRSFGAYASLPAEEVAALASIAVERRWRAGDRILEEGKVVTHLHFVITGEVELRRRGLVLRRYGPQSVVGGVAALAEDPEGYEAIATEDTITLEVPSDENIELFEENFGIMREVLGAITRQIMALRREMGVGAGFTRTEWKPDGPRPEPLDFVGRMAALRVAMPFAGTRLEALADLARDVKEIRLDDGDSLWRAGDPADSFIFIHWGMVESSVGEDTPNALLDAERMVFGPGDVVGSLATLSGEARWYDATVRHGLVGLRLDGETLLDVLEDHFDLALSMVRTMARGLLDLTVQVAERYAEEGREPPTRF